MEIVQWIVDGLQAHGDLLAAFLVGVLGGGLTLRAALGAFFRDMLNSPESKQYWKRVVYRILPRSLREFMHEITASYDESALG